MSNVTTLAPAAALSAQLHKVNEIWGAQGAISSTGTGLTARYASIAGSFDQALAKLGGTVEQSMRTQSKTGGPLDSPLAIGLFENGIRFVARATPPAKGSQEIELTLYPDASSGGIPPEEVFKLVYKVLELFGPKKREEALLALFAHTLTAETAAEKKARKRLICGYHGLIGDALSEDVTRAGV